MEPYMYKPRRSQPWVEKHRPDPKEFLKHQDEVCWKFKTTLENTESHIFIHGITGIGKSSVTLALIRKIFGPKFSKSRVLKLSATKVRVPTGSSGVCAELLPIEIEEYFCGTCARTLDSGNALLTLNSFGSGEPSLSRKLKLSACTGPLTVYDVLPKIKDFPPSVQRQGFHPHPPSMIVIIDEVHLLTKDDQTQLIGMMDNCSSDVVRFILECDCGVIISDIKPLASKCVSLSFKPLPVDFIEHHILDICAKEELKLDPEALSSLCSRRSLFYAITFLQRIARSFRSSIHVEDMTHPIEREVVEAFFQIFKKKDVGLVAEATLGVLVNDYDLPMYLSQLHDMAVEAEGISREQRDQICKRLAKADQELIDGGNAHNVMFEVAGTLMQVLCNIEKEDVDEFCRMWKDDGPSELCEMKTFGGASLDLVRCGGG